MPLLASSLAQNSTYPCKSLYLVLVTRCGAVWLVRLSATSTSSSTRQLVSPTRSHSLPIVLPSNSETQPGPVCPATRGVVERAAAMMSPPATANAHVHRRCIVISSRSADDGGVVGSLHQATR